MANTLELNCFQLLQGVLAVNLSQWTSQNGRFNLLMAALLFNNSFSRATIRDKFLLGQRSMHLRSNSRTGQDTQSMMSDFLKYSNFQNIQKLVYECAEPWG